MKIFWISLFIVLQNLIDSTSSNVEKTVTKDPKKLQRSLYEKISDQLMTKTTFLLNKRNEKYPEERSLTDENDDLFKVVDIHKTHPAYGVQWKSKKFEILRHAFPFRRTPLNYKPVLYERFKKRPKKHDQI